MKAIWKFVVPIRDDFTLTMPEGSVLLRVAHQHQHDEVLTLWALLETDAPTVQRTFCLVATGQKISKFEEPNLIITYIGTALMYEGRLVYHLFEWRPA